MAFDLGFLKGDSVYLEPHPESCALEDLDVEREKARGPVAVDLFC